jgi:hypothetical protein
MGCHRSKEIKEIIKREVKKYEVTFPIDFYVEMNKKIPWAKSIDEIHNRPSSIGRITNEIIYDRFPKDILPALQHLNPYVHLWCGNTSIFNFSLRRENDYWRHISRRP